MGVVDEGGACGRPKREPQGLCRRWQAEAQSVASGSSGAAGVWPWAARSHSTTRTLLPPQKPLFNLNLALILCSSDPATLKYPRVFAQCDIWGGAHLKALVRNKGPACLAYCHRRSKNPWPTGCYAGDQSLGRLWARPVRRLATWAVPWKKRFPSRKGVSPFCGAHGHVDLAGVLAQSDASQWPWRRSAIRRNFGRLRLAVAFLKCALRGAGYATCKGG